MEQVQSSLPAELRLLSATQMLGSMNLHEEVVELVSVHSILLSLCNCQASELILVASAQGMLEMQPEARSLSYISDHCGGEVVQVRLHFFLHSTLTRCFTHLTPPCFQLCRLERVACHPGSACNRTHCYAASMWSLPKRPQANSSTKPWS